MLQTPHQMRVVPAQFAHPSAPTVALSNLHSSLSIPPPAAESDDPPHRVHGRCASAPFYRAPMILRSDLSTQTIDFAQSQPVRISSGSSSTAAMTVRLHFFAQEFIFRRGLFMHARPLRDASASSSRMSSIGGRRDCDTRKFWPPTTEIGRARYRKRCRRENLAGR